MYLICMEFFFFFCPCFFVIWSFGSALSPPSFVCSLRVREAAKETLEAVFAENAPAGSLAAPTRCAPNS